MKEKTAKIELKLEKDYNFEDNEDPKVKQERLLAEAA